MLRDDVQLAQALATENGQGGIGQLSKRAANAPHEQGNDCQQQQQCPAGTRQYDGRLLEALVANAHQLLERLAASASGRKGVVAGILDQLRE
ncbi:hypothetical protein D3C75_986680 [compost metagenome]